MPNVFFVVAIVCAMWGIVSSFMIVSFLSKRGYNINWLFLRIMILKYIHEYHGITTKENGKPGPWFYSYIISMIMTLIFVAIGMALISI